MEAYLSSAAAPGPPDPYPNKEKNCEAEANPRTHTKYKVRLDQTLVFVNLLLNQLKFRLLQRLYHFINRQTCTLEDNIIFIF